MKDTAEHERLEEARQGLKPWRKWGPYLSERQWGTVREDYSDNGDAWTYFPHEHARSRAYRWGEDGLAGFSDEEQRLCLAVALWNGKDLILKERLFGLANPQGNHGEDVKEIYYYLDATPTHSYLKFLYKYPQARFPYDRLQDENGRRGKLEPEFELLDTGIFEDNRYFDIFVEYAKNGPEDIVMQITVHNRGDEEATLHVLPQLWFRNTWSWRTEVTKPRLEALTENTIAVHYPEPGYYPEGMGLSSLDGYRFILEGAPGLLFTENETNVQRLYDTNGQAHYFKDAFHDYLVHGKYDAVNKQRLGTKAAAHYLLNIPAGGSAQIRARLCAAALPNTLDVASAIEKRQKEADEFYCHLQREITDADARLVQRQSLANLIWARQYYYVDVPQWQDGDPGQPPPPPQHADLRNRDWRHLNNADILTMPDKWEYPYYCVWDTAFQCVPIALVDPEWAKRELTLFLREWYMHPNGAMPAYEWNFDDVNPPVHAWATWRVYQMDRRHRGGSGDRDFLERIFHKLMLNFTWWVNRKDAQGLNVFQGGFLGMDNIGVFDRSAPLPNGGLLNQADGTAWMAMFCLQMMRMALELARQNHVYEDVASKFFEHFLHIAEAMTNIGSAGIGLWDEEDRFYYDELTLPNGPMCKLKVRSMVGLIPLYAVEVLEPELLAQLPDFHGRLKWFLNYRPDLAALVSRWEEPGRGQRRLLSLLRGSRMKALLRRLLDETEFLSAYGPRSLSRVHKDRPYVLDSCGHRLEVQYRSAESDSNMFGGNSNWRGPVWFPVSYLIIESLQKFHHYYGDDFKIECPTGSGQFITILQVADELSKRLTQVFLRDEQGKRAIFGSSAKLQNDPNFRDYLFFPEYMDGDNGRGAGALRQGWTCLVAKLLQPKRSAEVPEHVCSPHVSRDAPAERGR
jgi:hypothetical protein